MIQKLRLYYIPFRPNQGNAETPTELARTGLLRELRMGATVDATMPGPNQLYQALEVPVSLEPPIDPASLSFIVVILLHRDIPKPHAENATGGLVS